MRNAKRGLKALGLTLVAAMGLMAFPVAGAQATWDIGGAEIQANESVGGRFVAGQEGLILVPTLNLVIHCKKFTVESGSQLLALPALDARVNLQYEECVTLVKGVTSPGCQPEILLARALLLQILHNGEIYILSEPVSGTNFTTIHYSEENCALPPLPTISGSFVYECYKGALVLDDCKTAKVVHLMRPAPAALFPSDGLKYGLHSMETHGEVEVFLTGLNIGQAFNALI